MMLHEIAPEVFDIAYVNASPSQEDRALYYRDGQVLLETVSGEEPGPEIRLPEVRELCALGLPPEQLHFAFRISGNRYFLAMPGAREVPEGGRLRFLPVSSLRQAEPIAAACAAATGWQLFGWYRDNRFCGRCGGRMGPHKKERALQCSSCGFIVYPRINPSVIIGVIRGSGAGAEMLLTRYNPEHVSNPNEKTKRAYGNYALVAGFIETGESPEMTVERETLEEVGLKVKNIRPYRSQPWPFSSGLLLGYVCEAEPGAVIVLEESELREAVWRAREEMPDRSRDRSLTSAIMEAFRKGEL